MGGGVWYWRQVATTVFITGISSLRLPGRKLVKLTVAAFAIVALGVGAFTWAKTIKDGQTVLKDCMIAKSAQAIECQKR
jgi:hypothetical protein